MKNLYILLILVFVGSLVCAEDTLRGDKLTFTVGDSTVDLGDNAVEKTNVIEEDLLDDDDNVIGKIFTKTVFTETTQQATDKKGDLVFEKDENGDDVPVMETIKGDEEIVKVREFENGVQETQGNGNKWTRTFFPDCEQTQMVDAYKTEEGNLAFGQGLTTDIEDLAKEYMDGIAQNEAIEVDQAHNNISQNLFSTVKGDIDAVKAVFDAHDATGKAKDDLLADCNDQVKEFFKAIMLDMNNKEGFTLEEYARDFAALAKIYQEELDLSQMTAEDVADSAHAPNIFDALDGDLEDASNRAIKFDFYNQGMAGNNGRYGSCKVSSQVDTGSVETAMNSLVGMITSSTGYSTGGIQYKGLRTEFDWFQNNWKSNENTVIDALDDSQTFNKPFSATGASSYAVDAYGRLIGTASDTGAAADYADIATVAKTYTVNRRYNNRNYGYAYSNQTYNVAAITVGNTQYKLTNTIFTSPLVLDMNGDGKLEASNGKWLPHLYEKSPIAQFDMNGDGFTELVEWVGPNDGLLLVYKEGKEVTGNDLFGEAGGWNNGYEKLRLYDANEDLVLNGEELAELSIWQDKNSNAKVDDGEIASLEEL